jgi:hypothetical protein
MTLDDAKRIASLESENTQLRQLVDDERRHLAALRQTVRRLHDELDWVCKRRDIVAEENARLLSGTQRGYTWPLIGAVGVALAGTGLIMSRRARPARSP